MRSLAQDLRYAVRLPRRSPGIAVVETLTLMLGISATSAIFGVVPRRPDKRSVLHKPKMMCGGCLRSWKRSSSRIFLREIESYV